MNVDDNAARKAELRKSLNSWRAQFDIHLASHPDERARLRSEIAHRLIELATDLKSARVACYLPFGAEPDVGDFIQWCLDAGLTLLLPVANPDASLHWVEFDGHTTKQSIFGFAEPHGPAVSLEPVDLIVVPALAVDTVGNRLGKGKGYYDRALGETSATLVGLVYDHEVLESLPVEPHDRRVDLVVTPTQTVRLKHG
jgi:5-formyltetrahydrofolate cyclo-ligase